MINGHTPCKLYYHPKFNQKDENGGINFMNIKEVDRKKNLARFNVGSKIFCVIVTWKLTWHFWTSSCVRIFVMCPTSFPFTYEKLDLKLTIRIEPDHPKEICTSNIASPLHAEKHLKILSLCY